MREFKISHYPQANDTILILLTILANLLLLFVGNQKSLIVVTLLYGSGLFFLAKRNLFQSVFFTTLLVLPFEYGLRSWRLSVITPQIPSDVFSIYSFYFGLSLKLIGGLTCLLLAYLPLKKNRFVLSSLPFGLISLWFLCIILSSFFAINQDIAWIYVARISIPVSLFLSGIYIYLRSPEDTIRSIVIVIAGTVLIQGLVGGYQMFIGHLSGVYLEESALLSGFKTTDGILQFRASGLMGHPTFYGNFLSMMLPVLVWRLAIAQSQRLKVTQAYLLMAVSAACLGIISSFSRSAWAICIGYILYLYSVGRKNVLRASLLKYGLPSLLVIVIFFGRPILDRLQSFETFFTSEGNGPARISLMGVAMKMAFTYPLLGVGPNHFTAAMHQIGLDEYTRYFIFPVHNVPLLFMAEIGLVGSGALFLFIFIILKNSYKSRTWSRLGGFWFGAIAYILSAQVHPLLNQDPTFDYFMLFLGVLYASTIINWNRNQKQTTKTQEVA